LIDENIQLNESLWEPLDDEAQKCEVRSGKLDWEEEVPEWVWTWGMKEEARVGLDVILLVCCVPDPPLGGNANPDPDSPNKEPRM
jgi:hypothetical protein